MAFCSLFRLYMWFSKFSAVYTLCISGFEYGAEPGDL